MGFLKNQFKKQSMIEFPAEIIILLTQGQVVNIHAIRPLP